MRTEGRRFLVTGGAGMIGSHVVDQLVECGAREVVVVDTFMRGTAANLSHARASGRVRVERADIRLPYEIEPHFAKIDGVFHLAGIRPPRCDRHPRECLDTLVEGTFNVLEAAQKAGAKKVVFSSSAAVYGRPDVFPTPERYHPWNSESLYGAAKVAGETMLAAFRSMYGLDYVILRYCNVYGPRMDLFGPDLEVLAQWLQALGPGRRPSLRGEGRQTLDFVYVRDCAHANVLAMDSDVSGEAINIGTGVEIPLRGVLEALLQVAGLTDVKPEYLPERAPASIPRRLVDLSKARDLIGFEAATSLEAGLREFLRWGAAALAAGGTTGRCRANVRPL